MPRNRAEAAACGDALLAQAQKGCLDWPARFIHPPIENMMVRLLLPTPITPNMVTLITAVVGFASIAAFATGRSEEHTSELQSLMRISYAVFCLKKKKKTTTQCTVTIYNK